MKGASQIAPFGLRLPEDLKSKIAERAKKNGRSMNSEVIELIKQGLYREMALDSASEEGDLGYDGDDEYQRNIVLAKEYLLEAINILRENPIKELPKKPT